MSLSVTKTTEISTDRQSKSSRNHAVTDLCVRSERTEDPPSAGVRPSADERLTLAPTLLCVCECVCVCVCE